MQMVELNGALSNPRLVLEIQRNTELRAKLLTNRVSESDPAHVKIRAGGVSEAVVTVLTVAGKPLRAREVHLACEQLLGEPVRWGTVKNALLSSSAARRFVIQRVSYGTYVHRDHAGQSDGGT
jgi:hypothetical protein